MLAIRLQRTGRSGHAQFRVIVQDSRFSPKRGRIVSYLGSYNPHTKTATLDGEKASKYLENGAQPSDRVARLFKNEGIKLPGWVKLDEPKKRAVRNPDKRRSTAPAAPAEASAPAELPAQDEPQAETAEEPSKEAETPAADTQEPAAATDEEAIPAAEETSEEPSPSEETSAPQTPAADSEPAAEQKAEEKPTQS